MSCVIVDVLSSFKANENPKRMHDSSICSCVSYNAPPHVAGTSEHMVGALCVSGQTLLESLFLLC